MSKRKLNRREFLKSATVSVIGALAAATGRPAKADAASLYGEAPMLKARVAAGTLPPVDLRLPQAPLIVGAGKKIGRYGGEIRTIHKDKIFFVSNYDLNAERLLTYSDQSLSTIVPNILESWQVSPDGKVWTFHLRHGMRWSDSSPLTSEDVRFWWVDYINHPDLAPYVPWQFRFGGSQMSVEISDDHTFKFTFAAPFGNFAAHLTRWYAFGQVLLPAAYMKQFHASYADPTALAALISQYGFTTWVDLFNFKVNAGGIWQGPQGCSEVPVLSPWKIISNPQPGLYHWERNPYYWKVDLANNQLPYIDTLRYDWVSNDNEVKLKLGAGQIDLLGQHDVSITNYPFYQANQSAGNYVIGNYLSCMSDRYVLFPQHYIKDDPVLTTIVNHPNFVKALSVAINREVINQSLFYGLATMGQQSVMPNSKYYKSHYATAFAQYDTALANQLLDGMGLDQRDDQGFRLRSDGQRLTFTIEHAGERVGLACAALTTLVANDWRAVGIAATSVGVDEGTYTQHMNNHQVHCGVWSADRCTDMLWPIEPNWYIPTGTEQGGACTAWARWYLAGDRSAPGLIVPPAAIQTLYGYFDQMTTSNDEAQRVQYGQQILDWLADTPLQIGLILTCPAPLLFNKHLCNLPPANAPIGWDSFGLSTYHPESFFYRFSSYLPAVKR